MVFEVTEKLDGTSMTVYQKDGIFGVCSRNLDLIETEGNTHWMVARILKLEEKLKEIGRNIALQGELVGHGIQKNSYKLSGQQFFLFDIWDIDAKRYLPAKERYEIAELLGIDTVPIIDKKWILESESISKLLEFADGPSDLCSTAAREGLVFKSVEHFGWDTFSFKAISNKFLLSE